MLHGVPVVSAAVVRDNARIQVPFRVRCFTQDRDWVSPSQRTQSAPDAIFSGHAHLYQSFTRRVGEREIPYIVSGSGGFAVTPSKSRANSNKKRGR